MKLLEILRRFIFVPIGALCLSYISACVYWVATGCRYGVKQCSAVFTLVLPYALMASAAGVIIVSAVSIKRIKRFRDALETCRERDADDESVAELDRVLEKAERDPEYRKLLKASAMLSCEQYDKCCEVLDGISFESLTASEEEEYFNMLVYCRLMQGETTLALEIYMECGHYFKRALNRFGTEHIRHTVGMIYYTVGEYDKAKMLFLEAKRRTIRSCGATATCILRCAF